MGSEDKETKAPEKRKRHRSPNYPAISLVQAIDRVRKLYKQDGKAGSPLEAALKIMGFSGAHGQAVTVVSALKKFGLVEDKAGRLLPTHLAIDILEFPDDHDRHMSALRTAALKPSIHAEIVDKYKEHGTLPSNESLKPELIADKGFNPNAVIDFLNDFRETLELAGILSGNSLALSEETPEDVGIATRGEVQREATILSTPPGDQKGKVPAARVSGGPCIFFDLPRDNAVEIRLRSKITKQELEQLKKAFEVLAILALVEEE